MSEKEIKEEKDLPKGKVISFDGDKFELGEKTRQDLCVWQIHSPNPEQKLVWVLKSKNALGGGEHFLLYNQLIKNIEREGFKISKDINVSTNLLKTLYEKRLFESNQKANSSQGLVLTMFEAMLDTALREKVSDIHIEVRMQETTIRMRKDGELSEMKSFQLTAKEGSSLCAVMYNVLAENQDVAFNPRDCQQGAVPYSIKGHPLRLRYQSMPHDQDGYDVVLRVLAVGRSEEFISLEKLGYTKQQVQQLESITSRRVGALVIAGVTGSGKSTTLKNILMYVNVNTSYKLKIYTIEDPPEYSIAKVTQIPVVVGKDSNSTQKVSPFEKPIKACMRGDPDIIMIGEVRDRTTGDLTKKAIQSGHQVLTTVHAVSALGIIDRFQDFGLDGKTLGSPQFLNGLLYQKLLPVLCPDCSISLNEYIKSSSVSKDTLELYKRIKSVVGDVSKYPIKMRSQSGCKSCGNRGIKGRTVCAEVISIDLTMMRLINEGSIIDLMFYWRSLSDKKPDSGNMVGKTCMEHGFYKMLSGVVCPRDVEETFVPFDEMLLDPKEEESYALARKEEGRSVIKTHKETDKEKKAWVDL